MRNRVPEAGTQVRVRSSLEGLSQSPIDHGIPPVHDPMTLAIKPRKFCIARGRTKTTGHGWNGGETVARKERRARVRWVKGERRGADPITVNSARRGFMAVRRRGITPVVSRYILKSRAHARKSRTKLHMADRDCGKAASPRPTTGTKRPRSAWPVRAWRDLPLGTVPWTRFLRRFLMGSRVALRDRYLAPRNIELPSEQFAAYGSAGIRCLLG